MDGTLDLRHSGSRVARNPKKTPSRVVLCRPLPSYAGMSAGSVLETKSIHSHGNVPYTIYRCGKSVDILRQSSPAHRVDT